MLHSVSRDLHKAVIVVMKLWHRQLTPLQWGWNSMQGVDWNLSLQDFSASLLGMQQHSLHWLNHVSDVKKLMVLILHNLKPNSGALYYCNDCFCFPATVTKLQYLHWNMRIYHVCVCTVLHVYIFAFDREAVLSVSSHLCLLVNVWQIYRMHAVN